MGSILVAALAGAAVLFLPGAALLVWLEPGSKRGFWERVADAAGLSFALTALLGLGFYLAGRPPGLVGLLAYLGLALAALMAAAARERIFARHVAPAWGREAAGGALFLALLAWRFFQARALAFPAWVDSVHHALIVRKLLDVGGLPPDLTPYLNVPFTYHYGFHIEAAAFAALSGLSPDRAVLWLGQGISALLGLGLYRLARAWGLKRPAALLAALLGGFVLYMPAYYTTWGRYPLLSGLVVFCAAAAAAEDALHSPRDLRVLARLGLLSAGLALTHYLALLVFALYLGALGLERLMGAARRRSAAELPWRPALACLAGVGAALPWLARMLAHNMAEAGVGAPRLALRTQDFDYVWSLLRPPYDLWLMGAAAGCLALAFLRPGLRRFAGWALALVFFALPFAPQPGPFRPDLFAILLFLPAAVLLGWGLAAGVEALAGWTRHPHASGPLLAGLALLLTVGGAWLTRSPLNPATLLADSTDREALDWVAAHTPAEARFFINAAPWTAGVYRGVDGGYWLLPYTGHFALMPPSFYALGSAGEVAQVNRWAAAAARLDGCTPAFWKLVREANLTYVYVRAGRGAVQPQALDHCPRLQTVYRQGGVVIYLIRAP